MTEVQKIELIQNHNEKLIKAKKTIDKQKREEYDKKRIMSSIPQIQKINYKKTPLCELAIKYQVDKCPNFYHYYTLGYYELLKNFKPKKMLEIGIGYYDMMKNYAGKDYSAGASLRMWSDFFGDCEVYGCDIVEECIFQTDKIKTILCDQQKPEQLKEMIKIIGNQDLIIDDGSHVNQHQFISFIVLWEYLNKGGKYIIEDLDKRILNGIAGWEELFEDCKCEKIYGHDNDIQGFVCFTKV